MQQLLALEALPLTTRTAVRRGRLEWSGALTPSALSETYVVALEYMSHRRAPAVHVVEPVLRSDEVRALPHIHRGDRLCLCYPWQWDDSKLIARTIIPWASEWLLHFEFFRATGAWHGGGHEPAVLGATS